MSATAHRIRLEAAWLMVLSCVRGYDRGLPKVEAENEYNNEQAEVRRLLMLADRIDAEACLKKSC